MIFRVVAVVLALAAPACADDLTRTDAFGYADASSYYTFDACGDPLAGRMFRRALAARVAECPFTPEARARFATRARAQRETSADALARLIETHDGLPIRLDGMTITCREQQHTPEYQKFRATLEQFSRGEIPVERVLPAACDADTVGP